MTQEKPKFSLLTSLLAVVLTTITLGFIYIVFLKPRNDSSAIPSVQSVVDKNGLSPYHKREVNNTIKKHRSAMQSCYNTHLANKPNIEEGKIQFDWQIEPDGGVEKVGVIYNEFQVTGIETCLKKEIESWDFPPPPEQNRNTYAEYTFHFRKQENLPKPEDFAPKMINTPKAK